MARKVKFGGFIPFLSDVIMKYNVIVDLRILRNGAIEKTTDHAKFVDKQDGKYLELLKIGKDAKVPSGSCFYLIRRKRSLGVDIYIDSDGNCKILKLDTEKEGLTMIDEDVRMWGRLKDLQTLRDYSNDGKLLKYLPHIILIGTMIALGVTIYITYMGFSQFMPTITAMMTKATEVLEKTAFVVEKLNKTGVVGPGA